MGNVVERGVEDILSDEGVLYELYIAVVDQGTCSKVIDAVHHRDAKILYTPQKVLECN